MTKYSFAQIRKSAAAPPFYISYLYVYLVTFLSWIGYFEPNEREWRILNDVEGNGHDKLQVLEQHLPGGTGEKHGKPEKGLESNPESPNTQ
jgi:hypothetical protein